MHIPFCRQKCVYCDFYSITSLSQIERFIDRLCDEIEFRAEEYSSTHSFDTVFFGGGTPSILSPASIERIISRLRQMFNIAPACEITLESNPGTIDRQKLIEFRNAGINRLSVGVQSFLPSDLEFLTRIHSRSQAFEAFESAAAAGFDNINIDLIFNLPGQTRDKWLANLDLAFNLPITHISAYSLILEPGTPLFDMVKEGKTSIAEEDFDADLYESTIDHITGNGYTQYEVSNFCRPGFECRHNLHYWHYDDYLGFGPSAHSFMNGKRWWNFASLNGYLESVNLHRHGCQEAESISPSQAEEEFLLLALRSDGLNIADFTAHFGSSRLTRAAKIINELERQEFLTTTNGILRLTKKGYAVCDEIICRI